ncbi:MAG TPA: adenine phosphoribosyltransferase [Firmicutes bacterium]|jgi:adenine phosphoribosyltransferase|nr:adenine phosphoribosyltransferase [Bacillota bacterium]
MDLKELIRVIPDFPKPGISFKDITTLLKEGPAFQQAISQLAELCRDKEIDLVVGPEARGFLVGAPLAYALGAGFVPVRKKGKLPGKTVSAQYELEYGTDWLEIHEDAISPGQRVLVIDDLLATGGTIFATIDLIRRLQGEIAGLAFLIELTDLGGRENLGDYEVISLIKY